MLDLSFPTHGVCRLNPGCRIDIPVPHPSPSHHHSPAGHEGHALPFCLVVHDNAGADLGLGALARHDVIVLETVHALRER